MCGPLSIRLHATGAIHAKFAETFALYDVRWAPPLAAIDVWAKSASAPVAVASGSTLFCSRMMVDDSPAGLYASTRSGASARRTERGWDVTVPDALIAAGALEELEDICSLILTEGWRDAGWVPMHAATIERDGRCAIVCAATGGGKTSFTAAFVRAGWHTLGDDKVLLRIANGQPELAALLHTFNLHPRTREWFPEVGELERLPRYSAWTEKRKVQAVRIWPDAGVLRARPTRAIVLERSDDHAGIRATPLGRGDVLDALLRQTVIPRERRRAAAIVATVAATAAAVTGLRLEVGAGAYADSRALAELERAAGSL